MQARAYPARLPGSVPPPGLVGTGRGGLFSCGSLGRPAPAGRGGASTTTSVCAVDGASVAAAASAAADSPLPPAQVTWQIVVGAVAGVAPFVVAGVEFGKRIIAQKKCEVCGGSGLVMKKDYYVRCQGCGKSNSNSLLKGLGILGFLPKQKKQPPTSWQKYLVFLGAWQIFPFQAHICALSQRAHPSAHRSPTTGGRA